MTDRTHPDSGIPFTYGNYVSYEEHMQTLHAKIEELEAELAKARKPCLLQISEPEGEYPPLPAPDMETAAGMTDDLTNREHQITELYATPQPAVQHGTDFAELQRLADCCPELNERNYDRGDVEELNAWAVEVAQCIDRTLATHPATPVAQGDAEDAARYRWLREGNDAKHGAAWHVAVNLYGCEWDAAIDAARSQAKEGGA